ncbi:MAG: glycosyltransferase [Candidatus Bathyarchaeota archaeon]|nr:MAG: glycosyltransferase [Candidatus Bathyarchaeota archaeon]
MRVTVIICAHNEERIVDLCLPSLARAVARYQHQMIVVADRCTDRTVEKSRRYKVVVVEKNYRKWRNSYAESLQLGLKHAKGKYIAIIDMDVVIPFDFFNVLLPMIRKSVVSVSPMVSTYPSGVLNSIVSTWQKTYKLAPTGRGTYGIRVILKDALDEIGGFKDVLAVDTNVDLRLEQKGFQSIFTPLIRVYHMRRETWNSIVKKQIRAGQSRRMIRYGLLKTLAHAVLRFRPFVIAGWIIGGGERK